MLFKNPVAAKAFAQNIDELKKSTIFNKGCFFYTAETGVIKKPA